MIAACVTLAGCEQTSQDQVVAAVNGEGVTLRELNAELAGIDLPSGMNREEAQRAVLQKLVTRRLLVQAAKRDNLDEDPDYIVQLRRLREELLANNYKKKMLDMIAAPDEAAIAKFIVDNPTMFSGKVRYSLDQLRFTMPENFEVLGLLIKAENMADVRAILTQLDIKFEQGKGALESTDMQPEMAKKIKDLPPGEPFVVPSPDGRSAIVNVITSTAPSPVPHEQARPIAEQALRKQGFAKLSEQRLKELKAQANIEYKEGYAVSDGAPEEN